MNVGDGVSKSSLPKLHNFGYGKTDCVSHLKTSQELRMLSRVTIDCQITKIFMYSGSQLSGLLSVSQMSQVFVLARIAKLP